MTESKINKAFPDVLILKDMGIIKGTRVFELQDDFRFFSSKGLIIAKKGFLTDGYSVPPLLHGFCNPFSKGMESSVLHDLNYLKDSPNDFDRVTCDELFLEGMKACGVGYMKRILIYRAVRSFGWRYFKKR